MSLAHALWLGVLLALGAEGVSAQARGVTGRGRSLYNGEVEFQVEPCAGGFRLRDPRRKIVTLDLREGTDLAQACDVISATPRFADPVAVSVHWAAQRLHDYYAERFGWTGWDGKGGELRQYVHHGRAWFNARFERGHVVYGDGGAHESGAIVSLDYVGHEVSHGVTLSSAGLRYRGESGALNESFSDVFAKCFERWATPERASWEVFPDIYRPAGRATRSFRKPESAYLEAQPRRYRGEHWSPSAAPHVNSGVMNHWFFRLVEGGGGKAGIGWERAEQIAFRTLTVYLKPNSDYPAARLASEVATRDLFGSGRELRAVRAAWGAVGVDSRSPRPVIRRVETLRRIRGVDQALRAGDSADWVLHSSSKVADLAGLADWQDWGQIAGRDFELRVTEAGGKALLVEGERPTATLIDVPFELWSLGSKPGAKDDVRLIPRVVDVDGDARFGLIARDALGWGYVLDHPAFPGEADRWTDMIDGVYPSDSRPGLAGYEAFVANPGKTGAPALRYLSIVRLHGTGTLPAAGTRFRLLTSREPRKPPAARPLRNAVVRKIVAGLRAAR